jgi:hypothetical protein
MALGIKLGILAQIIPSSFINEKSLLFDGVDESLTFSDLTDFSIVQQLTYSIWIKWATSASNSNIFGWIGTSSQRFRLIYQSGGIWFQCYAGGTSYGSVSFTPTVGEWYHLVGVFDGTQTGNANRCKIYINNVNQTLSFTGTIPSTTSGVTSNFRVGGAGFNAYADEPSVFDYALNSTQISSIYNCKTPTNLNNTSGLTSPSHWWRMGDNDIFPTIADVGTTGGNNGTMTNMESGDIVNDVPSGACYLLDTYSATAAYSLRQLRSDVNFVVRVRRSGDNAENDFNPNEITNGSLASWVDAGGGTQQGFVVTWYDQVGSKDLTQSTAAIQPEIYDNSAGLRTFGNGNCLSFPIASNNYMNIGSSISELNDAPFSIFAAAQNNNSDQGAVICENLNNGGTGKVQLRLDTDGTSNLMLRYKNSGGTNYDIGASTNLTSNTEYLISAFSDASKNISEFDNGNTGGTGTFTGNYTGNDFYIGKVGDASAYLKGKIAELIVFGTDESANRTAIESDINGYYSIY